MSENAKHHARFVLIEKYYADHTSYGQKRRETIRIIEMELKRMRKEQINANKVKNSKR